MVEIKRRAAGRSFINRRIGVVDVTTDRGRVAETSAQALGRVSDIAFQEAANMQVKAGEKFSKQAIVTNDKGELVTRPVPKGLGRYGREAASQELSRRYADAFEVELTKVLPELSNQAGGDPDALNTSIQGYLKKRYDLIEQSGGADDLGMLRGIADRYGAAAINKLRLEKIDAETKLATDTLNKKIETRASTIFEMSSNGSLESVRDARSILESTIQRVEEHPDFTAEQKINKRNRLTKSFIKGAFNSVVKQATSEQLNELILSLPNPTEEMLEMFPQIRNIDLTSEMSSDVQSDLRTFANMKTIQEAKEKKQIEAFQDFEGGNATVAQIDDVFESPQFAELSVDQQYDLYRRNQKLPSQIKSVVTSVGVGGVEMNDENFSAIKSIVSQYEQIAYEATPQGIREHKLGLEDDVELNIQTLVQAANQGDQALIRAYDTINTNTEQLTAKIVSNFNGDDLKENSSLPKALFKLEQNKLSDIPVEDRQLLKPVILAAAKIAQTPGEFEDLVRLNYEKNFTKSRYMYEKTNDYYAPEKIAIRDMGNPSELYPEIMMRRTTVIVPRGGVDGQAAREKMFSEYDGESDFERSVNQFLDQNGHGDLKLGKDVLLKTIPSRSDQTKAEYFLIYTKGKNTKGDSVKSGAKALVYSTAYLSSLIAEAKITRERATEAAQKRAKENL